MSSSRTIHNLALVGFMGTGKSTIGRMIADDLGFTFLDTDTEIESRTGVTITEIFTNQGEAAFRQLEQQLVAELADRQSLVISAGGGLVINPGNLTSLKSHALTVCLWASPERIWERVKHQSHRPLLQDPDPMQKIRTLLAAREPFYRQADVLINTELRSAREVANQVIHQFRSGRDGVK